MLGEISSVPGRVWRAAATLAETFLPGRWPPSPGLAPWPILISSSRVELSSVALTPKRPEAICWLRQWLVAAQHVGDLAALAVEARMFSRLAASA